VVSAIESTLCHAKVLGSTPLFTQQLRQWLFIRAWGRRRRQRAVAAGGRELLLLTP
jgi:hypothetical protein